MASEVKVHAHNSLMDGDPMDEEEICLFFEGERSRMVETSARSVRVKLI